MLDLFNVPARPHPFPLAVGSAALLVIDMQNDFCHPQGFCCRELKLDSNPVRAIIPKIAVLISWARQLGLPVIYTRESHRPDLSDLSQSKRLRYENAGYPVGSQGHMGRFLIQGDLGCKIIGELAPKQDDLQIDKPAQSAFIGTSLERTLCQKGITHLLVTGVTTQCCVLATYRDANDLGFYSLLLEDCCGAFDSKAHQAAIDVLLSEDGALGWVGSSTDLIRAVPAASRCV
jgi:nicotinamidase-related amidase